MSGILDKYDESINLTYNYTYRMLMHLKNISENYKKSENPDEITLEVYRDSIIKKYETLEDLTWKLLSKIFKSDGLEINSPRGCYKQAFKEGLIEDMIIWNDILLARNSTSHIYDEDEIRKLLLDPLTGVSSANQIEIWSFTYEAIKNNIINKYIVAIEKLLNKISMEML